MSLEMQVLADSHHRSEHVLVVRDSLMFIAETLGKGGQGGGEAQEGLREGAPLCIWLSLAKANPVSRPLHSQPIL